MLKRKLIVWLWNIWDKYENTKHNVWFKILDHVASFSESTDFLFDSKFNWELAITKDGKYMIFFLKPHTFMNLSWDSVSRLLSYYKIESKNMLVIHDEIDLDVWKIKLKRNGWDNWHNWLKDISRKIWTKEYRKLKMWVWRPHDRWHVVNYVLWKLPNSVLEHFYKNENIIFEYVRQFLINN